MSRVPLRFLLALLLALAAAPAGAQERDRLEVERYPINPQAAEDAGTILERTLPFRDGQILRYYTGDGRYDGYARRRALTIRFYDADGAYLGRAERVSQKATVYYAADGTYLGRRLNRKLTLKTRADVKPAARGFLESTEPAGQPGQD